MIVIKHFKLTNQDEIICEVVQWDDEETRDLVIRKALKIEPKVNSSDESYRYYTFTPWMAMQESINSLQTLNADHVISMSTPSSVALDYFADVVNEVSEASGAPELYDASGENENNIDDSDFIDSIIIH